MLCMDKAEDSLALGLLANSSELIFVEFFFLPLDILYILFFFPPSSVIITIYLFILTPTTIFHFLLLQSFKAM